MDWHVVLIVSIYLTTTSFLMLGLSIYKLPGNFILSILIGVQAVGSVFCVFFTSRRVLMEAQTDRLHANLVVPINHAELASDLDETPSGVYPVLEPPNVVESPVIKA
jgi:hypothetical protein